MKKIILKYSLLYLTLFFAACSSNQVDDKLNESKYCENEISFFSITDSFQSIKIDYNDLSDSVLNSIENKLQIDLCWKKVDFGLELTQMEPVKVQLLKECDDGIIRCLIRFPEVKVLLNHKGQLMIENNVIPIDSTKFWIHKNFPNSDDFDLEEILIIWTTETPKDSIEKAFVNIIDGYLLNYEELSLKSFSKNICDLTESQVDSLKNILPFNVRLGMGRLIIPPPPPTDEQLKELKTN